MCRLQERTLRGPGLPRVMTIRLTRLLYRKRAEYGLTTYRYEYAGNFSNIAPRPWIGASHSGAFLSDSLWFFGLGTWLTHVNIYCS